MRQLGERTRSDDWAFLGLRADYGRPLAEHSSCSVYKNLFVPSDVGSALATTLMSGVK